MSGAASLRARTAGAAIAFAALLAAGCGASDDTDDPRNEEQAEVESDPDDDAAAEEAEAGWTDDDIEYKLAVVDSGGFVEYSSPLINDYAAALDAAEDVCAEDRTMLADMAVKAVQLLDEQAPGHSENALTMLRAIPPSLEGVEDVGTNCGEVLATVVALMTQ